MKILEAALLACCALALASCHSLRDEADPTMVGVGGVKPTLEQLNVSATTAAQNTFVNDLVAKAGFVDATTGRPLFLPPRSPDWAIVTEAGIYEIGRQCDQYLDVLFHFNRNQRATRQGLTAIGATTATILGLASVAAAPIAIVAAAFGLSASLFDAGVNSVLFTIEPSALRNIVLQGRQRYLEKQDLSNVTTRPRMMFVLQGYLNQCSPATIEANVNDAARGGQSVASPNSASATNAALLAAPAATFLQRSAVVTQKRVEAPPPIPTEFRPLNAKPAEANVSLQDLRNAQAALGVTVDGDFGANDASDTRTALDEFQAGMIRRGWDPRERTRMLTGQSYAWLSRMSPMSSTVFLTPFERAYLGNMTGSLATRLTRVDQDQLETLLDAAGVPEGTWRPASPDERLRLLRAQLQVRRAELNVALPKGIDPARARLGVLDSALFEQIK